MKLMVECECGNKIIVSASEKKHLQLRDNLEAKHFRYDGAKIKMVMSPRKKAAKKCAIIRTDWQRILAHRS